MLQPTQPYDDKANSNGPDSDMVNQIMSNLDQIIQNNLAPGVCQGQLDAKELNDTQGMLYQYAKEAQIDLFFNSYTNTHSVRE